ncbi:hypothetical protein HanPI659440_Chr14g0567231 [Helianthus annuus]|nr:hypothetical protein HanPI659440_Chr14g0567231 [Helianthus annuus]
MFMYLFSLPEDIYSGVQWFFFRCSWSDSGSGWRGTHPSLTAILPTFVST